MLPIYLGKPFYFYVQTTTENNIALKHSAYKYNPLDENQAIVIDKNPESWISVEYVKREKPCYFIVLNVRIFVEI